MHGVFLEHGIRGLSITLLNYFRYSFWRFILLKVNLPFRLQAAYAERCTIELNWVRTLVIARFSEH